VVKQMIIFIKNKIHANILSTGNHLKKMEKIEIVNIDAMKKIINRIKNFILIKKRYSKIT
jgi:hypothetical protein